MTSASDLTVIIPTHRREEILARTLTALGAQTARGFETTVVVDGPGQQMQLPAGVTVLHQEQAGPGAARNRGVAATSRPLLLFLGDDMIPDPGLVERHLDWHARKPEESVAVLGHVDWHPEVRRNPILRWLEWSATQFDYAGIAGDAGRDVGFGRFYSCNVSLKRTLFDKVGGFDPDFVFYYEDLDLGWRLARAGMELIYEPRAQAHHLHDYDLNAVRRRFEGVALGERLMAAKHDWFDPFFLRRIDRAMKQPPARRLWTRMADVAPAGRLRARARERANTWYHQQVGPSYLDRWDRAADVVELREYLGDQFDARLLISHGRVVDAEARAAADERTFYRTSRSYLYDLTVFGMSGTKDPYLEELRQHVQTGATLLDYGCGIGADGLRLLGAGYDVHFADYTNPSTEYLRWRLHRRGRAAPVYDVESDEIPAAFDAVYAFDVIEHVSDPLAFLDRLEQLARLVVVNLLEGDDHDHHLHHDLPIDDIIERATSRGLLSHTLHHRRSHLLVYRGL